MPWSLQIPRLLPNQKYMGRMLHDSNRSVDRIFDVCSPATRLLAILSVHDRGVQFVGSR